MSGSGYKGFRSWAAQECPALKPGETNELRASKYKHMSSNRPTEFNIGDAGYSSFTTKSFSQVKQSDFKIPDRRGVMVHSMQRDNAGQSRPFLGTTTYQNNFDSSSQNRLGGSGNQALLDAFDKVAEINDGKYIYTSQIPEVLNKAFGGVAQKDEIDLMEKAFEGHEARNIVLKDFKIVLERLNGYFDESNKSQRSTQPTWLTKNTATSKVLQGHNSQSSHQIDYGKYGNNPICRPYIRKTGMASTTTDLMTGTSRDTHHIPGYGGFIPRTGNNPQAVQQGDGTNARAIREDLRLYHTDDLPGYTGHKPVSCANYRGEMTTGLNKNTTNGATYTTLMK